VKDIRIDGRMQRVFILKETETRVVYIPVKSLHRVDYERLKDLESRADAGKLLELMQKTTLGNGMNALVQFDNLIQVADLSGANVGSRIRKPSETLDPAMLEKQQEQKPAPKQAQVVSTSEEAGIDQVERTVRRPGRPKKS